MSSQADRAPFLKDGNLSFSGGVDANTPPYNLPRNQVVMATNTTMRGGPAHSRYGWVKHTLDFDNDSSLQAAFTLAMFQDLSFFDGTQMPMLLSSQGGRQFRIRLRDMTVSEITPATGRNSSIIPIAYSIQAENYWILQDNQSSSIIFNGASSRRSNPVNFEVPVGNVMCYAMGRLIVALPDRISYRVGDLVFGNGNRGDMLAFTENNYLNEGGDFIARVFGAPSNYGLITAMSPVAMEDTQLGQGPAVIGQPRMVFTVQLPFDRETWKSVTNALQTTTPMLGPVGHRAIVQQNGDLWYRSIDGIRSWVQARRDFYGPGNTPMSNELNIILSHDSQPLLPYCSMVVFDNRLLCTVSPVQGRLGVWHRGLAVMDFDLLSALRGKQPPCWEGIWTGPRILQMVTGVVDQKEHCYAFALSDDNEIELWELAPEATTDDGADIDWTIDFGAYNFGNSNQFKALEGGAMVVEDLRGTLTWSLKYRSDQNPCWQNWDSGSACALTESCSPTTECVGPRNLQPQIRNPIRFKRPEDTIDAINNRKYRTGYSFQPRLELSGHGQINLFRIHATDLPEDTIAERDQS